MRIGLALILCLVIWAPAQLVIRVDSSISRNAERSASVAAMLSAALPGMGQKYLGEQERSKPYLWADAMVWSATAISWFAGSATLSSLQSYASRYAGVQGPPKDPDFLDLMARYRSRDGVVGQNSNPDLADNYNLALVRAGQDIDELYPMDASHSWDWGSSENPETTARMEEYNNLMRRYRLSRIAFQVSVGALVLNRLVSVFDAIRIHRATSATNLSWHVVPTWDTQASGAQLVVGF